MGAPWIRRFAQRWLRAATDLCTLLIILHLPMALVFSLRSRLFFMTPWEIAKDGTLLVLVYAAVAALLALAIAVVDGFFGVFNRRLADYWMTFAGLVCLGIVLLAITPILQAWWRSSWPGGHLSGTVLWRSAKYAAAILAAIGSALYLRKHGIIALGEALSHSLHRARGLIAVLIVFAAAVATLSGHLERQPFGWRDTPMAPVTSAPLPNIFLISIDALSAGDMSLYGYTLPTTPNIDRFAAAATVFDRFIANSNFTTPTITSLLTGRYPSSTRVTQLHGMVRPEQRALSLPVLLREHGYRTAAVVANPAAHPFNIHLGDGFDFVAEPAARIPGQSFGGFGLLTFSNAKIFSSIQDWWWSAAINHFAAYVPLDSVQHDSWYPPSLVIDGAKRVLEANPRPVFLWTHFMPPHDPYLPPAPFIGKFLPGDEYDSYNKQVRNNPAHVFLDAANAPPEGIHKLRLRYDENIAYMDDAVGGYLDFLGRQGWLENSLVIIVADHGESFEKGFWGHTGPMLHQALVHVPLIVRLPGPAHGALVSANAEQVDLLPTVLDVLGLPIPAWADGESLLPMIRGGAASGRPKFSMNFERTSSFAPITRGSVAVIEGRRKFIHYLKSGCENLYDLEQDPGELRNLAMQEQPTVQRMRALFRPNIGVQLPAQTINVPAAADCANPFAGEQTVRVPPIP